MASGGVRCGSHLLVSLPDDVLFVISSHLGPGDLGSLSLTCRRLRSAVAAADKAWLAQCLRLVPSDRLLSSWRRSLPSYRHLCRFLSAAAPLLGLWVHQNPELGNLVFVSWGPHLSLLASRVIPQELSPSLLWAPVFEVTPSADASRLCFFLHGRADGEDSLHPGSVASVHPGCNVLLLEVESKPYPPSSSSSSPPRPRHARSSAAAAPALMSPASAAGDEPKAQFSKLAFGDRRRLLDLVSGRVRQRVPTDLEGVPLFANSSEEGMMVADRRLRLIQMHKLSGGGRIDWRSSGIRWSVSHGRGRHSNGDAAATRAGGNGKKRSFFSAVKKIMGRSGSLSRNGSSTGTGDGKHVPLTDFLMAGETVGLTLRAANMGLTTYRAWPNMHDNRFALYKLPHQEPVAGKEYAGLWGGTFGWPPGKTSADKSGKALFFLLISYEEVEGQMLLIATKILEGTHYVLHPNGSAMFIVKVDEPSLDAFPWETDGDDVRVGVKNSYAGEGIANGYGFRYPGSKPGSLFEMENGHLAFVWKESKAVLTLQRLDLEELLRKGERVPPLPPVANFAYLTKSYSNVFAGFGSNSVGSPSPRCGFPSSLSFNSGLAVSIIDPHLGFSYPHAALLSVFVDDIV